MNQQDKKKISETSNINKCDFSNDVQTKNNQIQSKTSPAETFPNDISLINSQNESSFISSNQVQFDCLQNDGLNENNLQETHSDFNGNQQIQSNQVIKTEQTVHEKNQFSKPNPNQQTQYFTDPLNVSDQGSKDISSKSEISQKNQDSQPQNFDLNSGKKDNNHDLNQIQNNEPIPGRLQPNNLTVDRTLAPQSNPTSQYSQFNNKFYNSSPQRFTEPSGQNIVHLQQKNTIPYGQPYDTFSHNVLQPNYWVNTGQGFSNEYYGHPEIHQIMPAYYNLPFYNLNSSNQQENFRQVGFSNNTFPNPTAGPYDQFYQNQPYNQQFSQKVYSYIDKSEQRPDVQISNQFQNQSNQNNQQNLFQNFDNQSQLQKNQQNLPLNTHGNIISGNSESQHNSFISIQTIDNNADIKARQFQTEAQKTNKLQNNEEGAKSCYAEDLIEKDRSLIRNKNISAMQKDCNKSTDKKIFEVNSINDDKFNAKLDCSRINASSILYSNVVGNSNIEINNKEERNSNVEDQNKLCSNNIKNSSSKTKLELDEILSKENKDLEDKVCESKPSQDFLATQKQSGDHLANYNGCKQEAENKCNQENITSTSVNNNFKVENNPNATEQRRLSCSSILNNPMESQEGETNFNNRSRIASQPNFSDDISKMVKSNLGNANINKSSELQIQYQNQQKSSKIPLDSHVLNLQPNFLINQIAQQSGTNLSDHAPKLHFPISSQISNSPPNFLNQMQTLHPNPNQTFYHPNYHYPQFLNYSNKNVPVAEVENGQPFPINSVRNVQKDSDGNDPPFFSNPYVINDPNNNLLVGNLNAYYSNQSQNNTMQQRNYQNSGQFLNAPMMDASQTRFLNTNGSNDVLNNNFINPNANIVKTSSWPFQNFQNELKNSPGNANWPFISSYNQNVLPDIANNTAKNIFSAFEFDPAKIINIIKLYENSEQNIFVEKFLISETALLNFSKILFEKSSEQIIRLDSVEGIIINFEKLKNIKAKFIGAFGRFDVLLEALIDNQIIKGCHRKEFEDYFNRREAGLYMIPLNEDRNNLLFVFILFSNDENDFDFANEKRDYTKLLRYLTQISNVNILAINQKDDKMINFKVKQTVQRHNKFVQKKTQVEEEKFEIGNGCHLNGEFNNINLFSDGIQTGFYTMQTTGPTVKDSTILIEVFSKEDLELFVEKNDVQLADRKYFEEESMRLFITNIFPDDQNRLLTEMENQTCRFWQENQDQFTKEIDSSFDTYLVSGAIEVMRLKFKKELEILMVHKEKFNLETSQLFERVSTEKISIRINDKIIKLLYDDAKKLFLESEKYFLKKLLQENNITDFDSNNFLTLSKDECIKKLQKDHKDNKWYRFSLGSNSFHDQINKMDEKRFERSFIKENLQILYKDSLAIFNLIRSVFENTGESRKYKKTLENEMRVKISNNVKKDVYYNFLKMKIEKSGDQNLVLTSIKLVRQKSYFCDFQLEFTKKTTCEPLNVFKIHKFIVNQRDTENAKCQLDHIIIPKIASLGEISLNESLKLVGLFFFKSDKIGIIINKDTQSQIMFYDLTTHKLNEDRKKTFGKTILLFDYNPTFKQVAYFSKYQQEVKVIIYQILEEMGVKEIDHIDLKYRFSIDDVKMIKIVAFNSLIVVDNHNQIHLIDHKNSTRQIINSFNIKIDRIFLLPKTNCLVLINEEIVKPYVIESANFLPDIKNDFGLCPQKCEIGMFETQIQIIYADNNKLKTNLLKCTLSSHMTSLCNKDSNEETNNKGLKTSKSIFDYFGFLYAKFSVHNPMDNIENQNISQKLMIYLGHCESQNSELETKIRRKLREIESNIKKPNSQMIGLAHNSVFLYPKQNHSNFFFVNSKLHALDRWIQELICFVPIQIARTENSQFIILVNGEPLYTKDFNNTYQIQKKITLGLYEPLLKNWNKEIKVITSMGKQSTGKSYTLNHLSGSSFAISAGRCTDGCWLTMKITDDCLYILLDFEGLGSFERSEQEDMLLSVLNASLSNITLYKTDYSLNKDTDKMFNRFNQGANLLKGSDNIFKGVFCIIIKDTRDIDVEELTKEFENKMKIIIQRENDKNFLTTMYKGSLEIFAFHSLEVPEYYDDMENLKFHIQKEINSTFTNGKDFLDLLKIIMAKIMVQDFTSLSSQDIDMRINMLNEVYLNAIYSGNISDKQISDKDFALKLYDKNDTLIDTNIELEVEDKSGDKLRITYDDTAVLIVHSNLSFIEILEKHKRRTHSNHNSWSEMLRVFIKKGLEKRIDRVLRWINANLEKWNENSEFKDLINAFKRLVSHKCKEIIAKNVMCLHKCDKCDAACTFCLNHNEAHSCGRSTHACNFLCDYCIEKKKSHQHSCHLNFGHSEKHRCKLIPHTCGLNCRYEKCEHKCCEVINHEGPHKCGLLVHFCNEKCSLPSCKNACQINTEKDHEVHKCISEQCTKNCDVQTCNIRCRSNDHFHHEPDLSNKFKAENGIANGSDFFDPLGSEIELDFHSCGNVHSCSKDCENPGYCKVIVESKIENKEFQGKRDKFNFQRRYENIGSKLKCNKIIERFQRDHTGDHVHSHDSSALHVCTIKCPTCQNICEKPHGHPGKHDTSHSNMANCYFIANQNDVNVGSHKYVVGEPSVAEMCNMFCKTLGRGHIHIIECGDEKKDCARNGQQNMRHEKCKYGPNEEVTKDEIHHSAYWDLIGFDDPTQEIDKEDFHKCPHYCASREHENEREPRYCQLDLWHKPVSSLTEINKQNGVLSTDGHYFLCSHPDLNRGYLFILCLDDSGSMVGSKWTELSCAVTDFSMSRRESITDKLTIIQFNTEPIEKCRNIPFKDFNTETHLNFRGGGTCFRKAIAECHKILTQDFNSNVIPVFIFMSDGEDWSGEAEMRALADDFLLKDLKIFTISFGGDISKLKTLADVGEGTYLKSIGGMDLKRNFQDISSKFSTKISVIQSRI